MNSARAPTATYDLGTGRYLSNLLSVGYFESWLGETHLLVELVSLRARTWSRKYWAFCWMTCACEAIVDCSSGETLMDSPTGPVAFHACQYAYLPQTCMFCRSSVHSQTVAAVDSALVIVWSSLRQSSSYATLATPHNDHTCSACITSPECWRIRQRARGSHRFSCIL